MDSPRPWLRYVDASDLDHSTITFDGLRVDSPSGEKLGDVDGAIVDVSSGRPYYVVVDAGGWFKSKYFLLPIGHVSTAAAQDHLVADLDKSHVERYPGFDRDAFEKLTDDELGRMAGTMAEACCPSTTVPVSSGRAWTGWSHYTSPTWWRSDYYRVESTPSAAMPRSAPVASTSSSMDTRERESVVAHGAQAGDVSPHPGGRAQPGDVIGLETGGEETHIGDTNDDENERRREAENAAAKQERD